MRSCASSPQKRYAIYTIASLGRGKKTAQLVHAELQGCFATPVLALGSHQCILSPML